MIISFGWNSAALIEGRKTVTRRDWPDSHAKKFKVGAIAVAYDKQPCWGGHPIARVKILRIERESLNELFADVRYARVELEREGHSHESVEQFVARFSKARWGDPYRMEFRLIERL